MTSTLSSVDVTFTPIVTLPGRHLGVVQCPVLAGQDKQGRLIVQLSLLIDSIKSQLGVSLPPLTGERPVVLHL